MAVGEKISVIFKLDKPNKTNLMKKTKACGSYTLNDLQIITVHLWCSHCETDMKIK